MPKQKWNRKNIVCAYVAEEQRAIVITVYQPDPQRWIDYIRRIV